MVLYEYKCPNCGDIRDTAVPGPMDCEKCNILMKRVYSFSGAVFKGDGFYRTDKDK